MLVSLKHGPYEFEVDLVHFLWINVDERIIIDGI
jgi:hypothetical protein